MTWVNFRNQTGSIPNNSMTRPGSRSQLFFDQLKRAFSDIEHLFGKSIWTLSRLTTMKSFSHLKLLFSLFEFRHSSFIMTRPELTRDLTWSESYTDTCCKRKIFLDFFNLLHSKKFFFIKNEVSIIQVIVQNTVSTTPSMIET